MFIFSVFILVMTIMFFVLAYIIGKQRGGDEEGCVIGGIVFGIILLICVMSIPITRVCYSDDIAGFKTIQGTVNTQRQIENDYEQAILTTKIIDANYRLAEWQNQNVWYRLDWWIPDSVEELEQIK